QLGGSRRRTRRFCRQTLRSRAQSVGHCARRMGIDADRQLYGLRGAHNFARRRRLHECGNQSEFRARHKRRYRRTQSRGRCRRARPHHHYRRRQTHRCQRQTLRAWRLDFVGATPGRRNLKGSREMSEEVVIVGMARTPMGGLLGDLASFTAPELGAAAVKAAVQEAGAGGADQIIMGNVLSAGLGQAPARQAALRAGLDETTQAVTVNKMCGSGLHAVAMARQALIADEAETVIAGGMESMSRAPYLMPNYRGGRKFGHDRVFDHMAFDGLEDAYEGLAMGVYADQAAKDYQFSRQTQDAYALETLTRAQSASKEGRFRREIIKLQSKFGDIDTDELPRKAKPEKIPSLKPAFTDGGTVTAANASAISDCAAALV